LEFLAVYAAPAMPTRKPKKKAAANGHKKPAAPKAAPRPAPRSRPKAKAKAKAPAPAPARAVEPDPAFAPVAAAFAGRRDVSAGLMMASFGLRVGGKIFAMSVRGRFVAKLPRTRVDALVAAGQGDRFEPGPGRVMKEWISVAEGDEDWLALAREAYDFVKGGARH
jgi:hypothetical protein